MNDGLAIALRFADFRCVFLVSSPFLRVFIRSERSESKDQQMPFVHIPTPVGARP